MKRICIVTTMWSSIRNWIEPVLPYYQKNNIDVSIVCNMDQAFQKYLNEKYPYVHTFSYPFPRGAKLLKTIKSINFLTKFFKREQFDLVQYSTPNASFYASVATKKAKIKQRLYCQWGMVYVTQKGIKRIIFKTIEKITCKNSTFVQPDSVGNLDFCQKNNFYSKEKSCVIWNGSAKGIDLKKYNLSEKEKNSKEIKEKYRIDDKNIVLGFVGRLGKEKGCNELFSCYRRIHLEYPNTTLLFVGPIEKEKTIQKDLLDYFKNEKSIIITDRVTDVEKYISAMDIFVLPSYREGFGMSVIEASSLEVPVICTKYPGPSSAAINGKTGILIEPKSEEELYKAIAKLINDPELRKYYGSNGRVFVETHFEQKQFLDKLIKNRLELLND